MAEKLIYGHAFRAMLKAGAGKLSAPCVEQLRALGVDPTGPLEAAYPAATWAACASHIARELFPGQDLQDAARQLARLTVDHYARDLIGRAMFALLRVIGAERTTMRMTRNFRSGSNFIETRLVRVKDAPVTHELWINDVSGMPGFYAGLLEGGMQHAIGRLGQVELVHTNGTEAVYHLVRLPPSTEP